MKIFCSESLTVEQQIHCEKELNAEIVAGPPDGDFYLEFSSVSSRLKLKRNQSKEHGIFVDFADEAKKYQQQKLSPKKDLLAKAVGVEPGLKVCDLTLGLAGDAFKLCYFGASVTGFEKNQSVWALVENARWRYQLENEIQLQAMNEDSLKRIDFLLTSYDVFYLDPMFALERSALPRKEMQYLEVITEPTPEDEFEKIFSAMKLAKKKLVVKRAVQNEYLLNKSPQRSVEGKMIRFDIY